MKGIDTRRFPVESVSWDQAMEFCERLSNILEEKKAGRVYCLPTEAEWEYACRVGAAAHCPYHFGNSLSPEQANFSETNLGRTCPVGSFPANPWGLFDMHGNVWEWCLDCYDEKFYQASPKQDPKYESSDQLAHRVVRGGSWGADVTYCRTAKRLKLSPWERSPYYGFRVCCVLNSCEPTVHRGVRKVMLPPPSGRDECRPDPTLATAAGGGSSLPPPVVSITGER